MWFLGAGASASAGIPTAWDMIWEFKQSLFASRKRVSLKTVSDLTNPVIRKKLQEFIDSTRQFPHMGSPDEYAALFEAVYPNEGDRRSYIDAKLDGAKPSYGHIALATLMKADKARVIWTTNFDTLVADAAAKIYDSTGKLTSVSLDAPVLAQDAFNNNRWPVEIKLHGDFRSRRLKNTTDELRKQDIVLRKLLVNATSRNGLIITGYSGRDESIMETLNAALDGDTPFPSGLFWLQKRDSSPLPAVIALLQKAHSLNVDGGVIYIENFDEILLDLIKLLPNIDITYLDNFAAARKIWSPPPKLNSYSKAFPIVRLNALQLIKYPTICRKIECKIGGHLAVADAITKAGVFVIATRAQMGVLAFGSDDDMRKAFSNYQIDDFSLHTLEIRKMRYDSQERGLLRQALSRALATAYNLTLKKKYGTMLLYPTDPQESRWSPLKAILGGLSGIVPKHSELTWHEGIGITLGWADDKLWLLFAPRIIIEGISDVNRAAATDFSRERTVKRYNQTLNSIIDFWAKLLSSDNKDIYALNVSTGVDAIFKFAPVTAFSYRLMG
jgi:hypothetical protein